MTREQRISLVVLGVCGVLAFGLSLNRISHTIRSPFLVEKSSLVQARQVLGETDEDKINKQKRLDTDGDGLSDWDESNLYRTNPNLRDSCGDGIVDSVRVATGRGLVCLNAPSGALDLSGTMSTSGDPFGLGEQGTGISGVLFGGEPGAASGTLDASGGIGIPNLLPENVMLKRDPDAIRAVLREKIPPEQLEKITDEELLKLYDAAMWELEKQQPNAPAGEPAAFTPPRSATSSPSE